MSLTTAIIALNLLHQQGSSWFQLNELDLTTISQGWGVAQRDKAVQGGPLTMAGKRYLHGIGTHANSLWKIRLKKNAIEFQALVGAEDHDLKATPSMVYKVLVDGKLVAQSTVIRIDSKPELLKADLRGAEMLELVVTDGGDNNSYDRALWIEPAVRLVDARIRPESISPWQVPAPQDMTWSTLPTQKIKCVFVVASDDDGMHGRSESLSDCQKFVQEINAAYKCASIQLEFDPATSYVRRNSTALNRLFDSSLNGSRYPLSKEVLEDPAKQPPKPREEEFAKAQSSLNQEFPEQIIFLLMNSSHWNFSSAAKQWVPVTSNGGFASKGRLAHIMSTRADAMIHEMGHLLGLPHTHETLPGSLEEYRKSIEKSLSLGSTLEQAIRKFDGDGFQDTPPDPGSAIFAAAGHRVFVNDGPFNITCALPNGSTTTLPLNPDPLNWMGYHPENSRSHPSTNQVEGRFSKSQCKFMWLNATQLHWQPVFEAANAKDFAKVKDLTKQMIGRQPDAVGQLYARITNSWASRLARRSPSEIPQSESSTILSDCAEVDSKVGDFELLRDRVPLDHDSSPFLTVQSQVFEHGIFAAAPSILNFDLGKKWTSLAVRCGVQECYGLRGSVGFAVLGDGRILAKTSVIHGGSIESLVIDLKGVKTLSLVADDGGDGKQRDWALWLDTKLSR